MEPCTAETNTSARSLIQEHFGRTPAEQLVTANRKFPPTSRVDLQVALERWFQARSKTRLVGVHAAYEHETMTFAHLLRAGEHPVIVSPLRHDEVDAGDAMPKRCLHSGLWLACEGDRPPFAVLLSSAARFGQDEGLHVEIAVTPGEDGLSLSHRFLAELEKLVMEAGSYRGKVISLEGAKGYSGKSGGIKVHKLSAVPREAVILPEQTIRLLERNVTEFVEMRDQFRRLGMATKKGLLFYGPPGTGKTHTIRYLASLLPGHTTMLITAEQVGLIDEYFQLARFLQPAMVVIEDVDLIARARERMRGACEESLLNRLLNEMDGLREDAAILFVLTTNRPEQLEAALASRPGRVDQAIEFPLPDKEGRRKLVQLYSGGLSVPEEMLELLAQRTQKASAAFIKELMRRTAQNFLRSGGKGALTPDHVEPALDEMLFSGGSLNLKLLGVGAGV